MNINWGKMNNLIPAIVQDAITGQVLMLGYMNQAALRKTQTTGQVWFYSRSKQRLWQKGETSGNTLRVQFIAADCDNDTVLIRVVPAGPACHTGCVTCFGNQPATMLEQLEWVIKKRRKTAKDTQSYTQQLFAAGMPTINAKIIEEATEVTRALEQESNQRVIEEMADVLYHIMVGLGSRQVNIRDVLSELYRRSV